MTTPSQMSDLVRLLSHRGLDPKQIAKLLIPMMSLGHSEIMSLAVPT